MYRLTPLLSRHARRQFHPYPHLTQSIRGGPRPRGASVRTSTLSNVTKKLTEVRLRAAARDDGRQIRSGGDRLALGRRKTPICGILAELSRASNEKVSRHLGAWTGGHLVLLGEFLYLRCALALCTRTGPHVAGGLPFPFRLPGGRRPRPRDRHASELSVLFRRPLPLGHCALSRALQAGRAAASLHQDVHHACTARLQHVFPHLPAQVHAKQSEPTRQSACNRCTYPPRTSACEAERTCHVKQSDHQ